MTDTSDELRRQAAALTAQAAALELSQLTEADIAGWKPEAINQAREAGRLQVLLGADPDEVALTQRAKHGRIDVEDVKALWDAGHHALIETARADDRIDHPTEGA
jgi:hypothetical protein